MSALLGRRIPLWAALTALAAILITAAGLGAMWQRAEAVRVARLQDRLARTTAALAKADSIAERLRLDSAWAYAALAKAEQRVAEQQAQLAQASARWRRATRTVVSDTAPALVQITALRQQVAELESAGDSLEALAARSIANSESVTSDFKAYVDSTQGTAAALRAALATARQELAAATTLAKPSRWQRVRHVAGNALQIVGTVETIRHVVRWIR